MNCPSLPGRPASEVQELNTLFDKYVPAGLDLILEGLVDGRQEAKIKTIVPLTNLNMVNWQYTDGLRPLFVQRRITTLACWTLVIAQDSKIRPLNHPHLSLISSHGVTGRRGIDICSRQSV